MEFVSNVFTPFSPFFTISIFPNESIICKASVLLASLRLDFLKQDLEKPE